MKVTKERWAKAQDDEIKQQQVGILDYKLFCNTSFRGFSIKADIMGIDFKTNFKDKTIIEVGAGLCGAVLMCEFNFKRAVAVEPLMNKFPSEVMKHYKENNIEVIVNAYEWEDLGYFDETWLFNVLQHVICPEDVLKKASKTSDVIRVFEPIGWPVDLAHPHLINKSTFTTVLGDFGQIFKGGSIPNFHAADCYYGTWVK